MKKLIISLCLSICLFCSCWVKVYEDTSGGIVLQKFKSDNNSYKYSYKISTSNQDYIYFYSNKEYTLGDKLTIISERK